jgi:hypothetical protein
MSIFNRKKKRIAELEAKLDETEMSLDKLNGAIEDVLWFQGHDVFLRGLIAYVGETESPVGRPPELRRKERKADEDLRQARTRRQAFPKHRQRNAARGL